MSKLPKPKSESVVPLSQTVGTSSDSPTFTPAATAEHGSRRCYVCAHWRNKRATFESLGIRGECHCGPPAAGPAFHDHTALWPVTLDNDYCGQFQPKPQP